MRGATGRAAAAFVAAAALVAAASCSQQRARRAASASSVRTTSTSSPTSSTTTAPASTTATTVGASLSASSPVSTAHGIASAEDTIRRADASPDELRRAGEEQQIKYRLLVIHPEWIDQVLANLPDRLRPIVRANAHASTELRLLTKPHPALPQWRIVAPAPAEELLADYKEAERRFGVPWYFLAAIHVVETKTGRIRGASDAGARGPMQFLPATWSRYGAGGDIESNHDSILAAARLLSSNGAPSRMSDALFSYNRSAHYVAAVTEYAQLMRAGERAFLGYYQWRVFYRLAAGDRLLPEGYPDVPAVEAPTS